MRKQLDVERQMKLDTRRKGTWKECKKIRAERNEKEDKWKE